MQSINNLFNTDNYLKKFRVFKDSQEDLDWKLIGSGRCPICSNKLKFPLYKEIVYCKSKKHKPFILTEKRYNEIINKIFIK